MVSLPFSSDILSSEVVVVKPPKKLTKVSLILFPADPVGVFNADTSLVGVVKEGLLVEGGKVDLRMEADEVGLLVEVGVLLSE
jgi:hypothetical protein